MKNFKWVGELIAIVFLFYFVRKLVHLIGADSYLNFIFGFFLNVLTCSLLLCFAVYRLTIDSKTKLTKIRSFLKFQFLKKDIWLVLLLVAGHAVFYAIIMKLEFVHIFSSHKVLGRPEFAGYQSVVLIVLILIYIIVVGFFEELYFRMYLFSVQYPVFQKYTWIINGFAWSLFHIPLPTNFVALLPTCFLYSYVYQKRRNIWITIIAHLITNSIVMIPAIKYSINQI